jgi:hypothetical protein
MEDYLYMMRASLFLIIPAAILISIGIFAIQGSLTTYSHFVNQDTRGFIRYACEMHPRGDHLVRQDIGDDPAATIPCLCSSLTGCTSVSEVESWVYLEIMSSAVYLSVGAGLLGAFFILRKYPKPQGILGKRS